MIQIDLITGFLGAGKTTFLHHYAEYLIRRGLKTGIIENDFGAVNVDMMILQDLECDLCERETVAGSEDLSVWRRRFRTKLISMGMRGFDRVLIEPSGIFDAEEFFDALCEEPLSGWYKVGSVIAIVDPELPGRLSPESEALLASQLFCAGSVVMSRTRISSREEIKAATAHLNRAMETYGCPRRFRLPDETDESSQGDPAEEADESSQGDPAEEADESSQGDPADEIVLKDWSLFSDSDYRKIMESGYRRPDHRGLSAGQAGGFQSLYYLQKAFTQEQIREAADRVFADKSCGLVYRIKGFVPDAEGWLEINATKSGGIIMRRVPEGQAVIIVIGEKLDKARVNSCMGQQAV